MLCEAVGVSPRDVQRYACSQCGKEYGHMKFDRNALLHFKRPDHHTKLFCQQCKTESASSSASVKVRQRTLLSMLRHSDALRCTCCGNIPRGQKANHALNHRVHTEKCRFASKIDGEKLWDGKDKGFTLDDLRFLLDRKAY